MNILIMSVGTRNKIVQYFKKELSGQGKVIATDCSEFAPALYDADQYYVVPAIDEICYLDTIKKICKSEKIDGILSLIDPELNLLAKHKTEFKELGTTCLVSSYQATQRCFDKFEMYKFLCNHGFRAAKSYIDIKLFEKALENKEISFPVFVKPVRGSASMNIHKVTSIEELKVLYSKFDNLMIQEYLYGTEYGVDAYIDAISNETIATFCKEKIQMRAGETDKAISIKDEKLVTLVQEFIKKSKFRYMIDIDILKVNGEYYISEVNPRFGGGYIHAYECGVNFPALIINNLNGLSNSRVIGAYEAGICMMKYSDAKIFKMGDHV